VLRAWRKTQLADRLFFGEGWMDSGRVFTTEEGSQLHPAAVTQAFKWASFDAGLPPIRLHDLRHCAATLAFAAGADIKAVSSLLRHSSIAITADTYTEVLHEVHVDVAAKMTDLVPRKRRAVGGSETAAPAARPQRHPRGLPNDSGSEF
jgi:integrase